MFTLSNFSRYQFAINEIGSVIAYNKATEDIINLYTGAKTPSFRLTNDEGKRVVLSEEKIKEQMPKEVEIPTLTEPQTLVDAEAIEPVKNIIHNPEFPTTPTLIITAALPETKKTEAATEAPVKKAKTGKLTEEQIVRIHNRANNGEKQAALAMEFKIHASTVSEIKSMKLFKKLLSTDPQVTQQNHQQK